MPRKPLSDLPTTAGIYRIRNKVNGYFYVGSAVNLRKRWSDHRSYLTKGKHHNPRLQAAWNKYGADAFEYMALEMVDDLSQLLATEQKWIDGLQAGQCLNSYNFCLVAGSQLGRKRSKETCERLRVANTGKKHTQ